MSVVSTNLSAAKPQVIFLRAATNESKMSAICKSVQHHFNLGHTILIAVPSHDAALYVDQLLWRFPEESFLPHAIADAATTERVVITMVGTNVNQASILLNLCPMASSICMQFTTVYELLDETHPDKLRLSQQRQSTYESQGLGVYVYSA
jgi:DNA polymerase IIIc chi subunit